MQAAETYRVDYATDDQPDVPVVRYGLTRKAAMRLARKLSNQHGSAYAIRRVGDQDTGQRVYVHGEFAVVDDQF